MSGEEKTNVTQAQNEAVSPEELVAQLELTFFSSAARSTTERRAALGEVISAATRDLNPDDARVFIDEVRRRMGGEPPALPAEPPQSSGEHGALAAENETLRSRIAQLERELALHSAAYDSLAGLSAHFLGGNVRFEKPEQIERFCGRIKDSFAILLSAFKDLLKGRKRFQMEYAMFFGIGKSMEGTRIIRTGEDKDVGKKFFEWDTLENVEGSTKEMEQALDELKYHQLAFLSGYKHSVKDGTLNAVARLAPPQLEKELAERKVSVGPFSIPGRLLPWKRRWLYGEYRRRFAELAREDVQYFEAKFRNAFTSGYVEVMNRKAKAQEKGQPDRG